MTAAPRTEKLRPFAVTKVLQPANPWHEGAAGLRDLGNGEWTQFLCVEASNILGAAVNLAPGKEHRMTAVLSVEKF